MTGRGHPASRAAEGWLPSGVTAPMCARAVGRCWEPHARPGAGTHPCVLPLPGWRPLLLWGQRHTGHHKLQWVPKQMGGLLLINIKCRDSDRGKSLGEAKVADNDHGLY